MKNHSLFIATLLVLSSLVAHSAGTATDTTLDAKAAYSRLSSLAGEWEADTNMGKAHVTYELIAGGTALSERDTMEHMPPMQTVYYLDGKRLLLTHYCMAGNQPRMQATAFHPETGELKFSFLDATNLAAPSDGHMHSATLRLVDSDHLVSEWDFYEDGQKKSTESFQFVRIR
jgi:hypothetical protein